MNNILEILLNIIFRKYVSYHTALTNVTQNKKEIFFHITFFSLFTFDPCRGNENKLSHHFRKLLPF